MPSRWGVCGPTTGRRLIRSHRAHPHSNPQAAAQRAADGISSGAYGEVRTQPTERVDDGVRERCSQRRCPITSRITCRAGEHPGERTRSSRHLGAICGAPACSCTRPSEARSPRGRREAYCGHYTHVEFGEDALDYTREDYTRGLLAIFATFDYIFLIYKKIRFSPASRPRSTRPRTGAGAAARDRERGGRGAARPRSCTRGGLAQLWNETAKRIHRCRRSHSTRFSKVRPSRAPEVLAVAPHHERKPRHPK